MVTQPALIQCSLSAYWWCGRLLVSASLEPDCGADSAMRLLLQTTSINEGVSMYSQLQELIVMSLVSIKNYSDADFGSECKSLHLNVGSPLIFICTYF